MNESSLDFEIWMWLERQRKRLAQNKRVRQSRRELAELLLKSQALIYQLEREQQRRRPVPQRPAPDPVRPGTALVRKLGLVDKVQHRSFSFSRGAVNDKTREVALTVSSDEPYQRHFGTEILDHSPSSIRMSRFLDGSPLLFNHSPEAHIGTIVSARTDGKRLRVQAKFGNSPLAREKYQDVADGILTKASIGYVIHNMTETKRGVFRATDWEPYEGSLVTIPADGTVGVGRSV